MVSETDLKLSGESFHSMSAAAAVRGDISPQLFARTLSQDFGSPAP